MSMTDRRLNVGIVGCGMIAQVMHIPHLRSLPALFAITGICDLSAQTMQALAARYAIPHSFPTAEDMLASLDLDAVLILTPYHYPVAMAALDAGVHVFIEKPMCVNAEEAAALVAKARARGLTGQVGYHKPYDPGYCAGAEMIRDLDDIHLATMHIAYGPNQPFLEHQQILRFGDIDEQVQQDTRQAMHQAMVQAIGEQPLHLMRAYGNLLGSGCHQLSIMRGCLGRIQSVCHTSVWNGGMSLASTLIFESGVRCLFSSVFMPGIRMFSETLTAYAGAESVAIQFPSPFLHNAPARVKRCGMVQGRFHETEITADYTEAFRNELIHFHQAIVTGTAPRTPLEQGAEDAQVMIEIIRQAPDFQPDTADCARHRSRAGP